MVMAGGARHQSLQGSTSDRGRKGAAPAGPRPPCGPWRASAPLAALAGLELLHNASQLICQVRRQLLTALRRLCRRRGTRLAALRALLHRGALRAAGAILAGWRLLLLRLTPARPATAASGLTGKAAEGSA